MHSLSVDSASLLYFMYCTTFVVVFNTACVYSNTGNNTLHIHPSDEVLYYPPKSTVTLNCTLSPAEYSRYTITWYIIVNDSYVKPSYHNEFISQTANYSEILCQWTNTLTIRNFSKELEGNYTCGFHRHWKNQTIALLREGECKL